MVVIYGKSKNLNKTIKFHTFPQKLADLLMLFSTVQNTKSDMLTSFYTEKSKGYLLRKNLYKNTFLLKTHLGHIFFPKEIYNRI